MKKLRIMMGTLALTALLAGCASQTSTAEPIGIDAAKTVALEDAGVSAADASFTTAGLDRQGDLEFYDVEFSAGGQTYDYQIDALTGVVIDRGGAAVQTSADAQTSTDSQTDAAAQTETGTQTGTASTAASATTSAGQSGGTLIGETAAKQAALAHAGLQESDVTFLKQELDWEDGRQIYEVEFYTADRKEYDYEIDALTGAVLSYDYDAEASLPAAGSGTALTAAEAKALALAQVPGATEADIWKFETDRDDGRLEYEGEIRYDGMEYEFEIDGYSGAIRSWEAEPLYG